MAEHPSGEWLAGAACHSCADVADADALAIRLSELPAKQKRELAGVAAAALATTAFVLLPALSPESLRQPLPSSALTVQFAPMPDAERDATTIAAVVASPAAKPAPRPGRAGARALRPAGEAVSAVNLVALRTMDPVGTVGMLVQAPAVPIVVPPPAQKRGGSALARALLGTGRHKVRPFPVPAADDDDDDNR
ncbi:MAG TPA: hypothetical protein VK886_19130 [Vicinamibacterales bacterium]|nr:hypothetical protein [Vicinamibacterales bacterium]